VPTLINTNLLVQVMFCPTTYLTRDTSLSHPQSLLVLFYSQINSSICIKNCAQWFII